MSDYSATFPSQRPVFSQDFAQSGKIDPRATFSRASTANVFDGAKHLSSENLISYSNDINTGWTKGQSTVTSNQSSPDGGTTAALVTEDTAYNAHSVFTGYPATSGTTYTYSGYFKANGRTLVQVRNAGTGADVRVEFDLSGSGTAITRSGSPSNVSISQIGSTGWYKCSYNFTAGGSSTYYTTIYLASAANTITYTGDGTSGAYVWGQQLNTTGETVLNATSGSIHREYASSLVSKANNIGRFEVGVDGQSMGVLLESQSTNLYSNSLDMTGVSGVRTHVDSNAAVGPTGALTADALRLNDTNANTHYREYSFTAAASTTYTFSVYLKAAGLSHAAIRSNNLFSTEYVYFNLSNGTVEGSPSLSNSMTAVGNGFYRCSVTATTTGSGAASFVIYITDSASSTIVATGDSYRAILGQAIQIEAGSHASSFIETSGGSTATRAADSLSMPIASTGYTGGPVTLLADSTTETDTNNPITIIMYRDGNNQIDLFGKSPNNRSAYIQSGSQYSIITTSSAANGVRAMRVDTNDIATAINGTIDGTDTSQTLPDLTGATVYIGDDSNGGNSIDGHIKRVAIYNEALSDTNLQALTS